jgi:hypothetical protein
MSMEQLSVFFAGSILFTLGVIVIAAGIVAINNIMHRYWQPVTWFKYDYKPVYFDPDTGEQLVKPQEPTLDTKAKK